MRREDYVFASLLRPASKMTVGLEDYERALELLPVGLAKVHEFKVGGRAPKIDLQNARHAYVMHIAECSTCSRRVVGPYTVATTPVIRM